MTMSGVTALRSGLRTIFVMLPLLLSHGASADPIGHSAVALFARDGIVDVAVSPTGEWILAYAIKGNKHGLLVQGRGLGASRSAFAAEDPITRIAWAGPRTYIGEFWTSSGPHVLVGRIVDAEGGMNLEHSRLHVPGRLVDPLPLVDEVVAWRDHSRGRSILYRVTLEELERFRDRSSPVLHGILQIGEVIASTNGRVLSWVLDRRGTPRAALRIDGSELSILTAPEGRTALRVVRRWESRPGFSIQPVAVSRDARRLIVLARAGRDTIGVHEIDMRTGELLDPLFVHEEADVLGARVDDLTGRLVAAQYMEAGEIRSHHFEGPASRHAEALRRRFPLHDIEVVSADVLGDVLILRTSGPDDPGTFHLFDARSDRLTQIARSARYARGIQLMDVETLRVEAPDGAEVEAFLTLPRQIGAGGVPLVVQPHGGPSGVLDYKQYDQLAQYLVSWGFAFLQVNYRGSGGYGSAFLEAGFQQWGRGIEDDIDAAVEAVIARAEVDASRVCIIGGSYGGFSAVASVVRHQDRYRCAATLNGVSDIPLMFEESRCADDESCLDFYRERIGDPETDRASLIEVSPVYHTERIQAPILIAYGTEDRTVDPDHSHRLIAMLELQGKPHEVLEIDGAAHSPSGVERMMYGRVLRRFLTRHLMPDQRFIEDPMLETDSAPSTYRFKLSP